MLTGVIHARGLARTFRKKKQEVHAVVGVDLDVEAGEIVGFLGPNGAGKTTTLRMLTTLLEPTAGTATVAGCDLIADPVGVRRRIGYVSQSGSTAPEARAGEEVVDHARLYGMSTAEATARGKQLFRELDLDGLWERQPKTLSGGQRRRLDIALGLVHVPGAGVPRRADHRAGPAGAGQPVAAHPRACARSGGRRSSSPPTTSTRPTRCATGSWSSTTARSSPRARRTSSSPRSAATSSP